MFFIDLKVFFLKDQFSTSKNTRFLNLITGILQQSMPSGPARNKLVGRTEIGLKRLKKKMENFFKTCGPLPENNYNDGKNFGKFLLDLSENSITSSATVPVPANVQNRTIYGGNKYKLRVYSLNACFLITFKNDWTMVSMNTFSF